MAYKLQSPTEPHSPQFGARLSKVESTLEEVEEGAIVELQNRVTELQMSMTGLETRVSGLETRVSGLETKVGMLADRVGNLESRMAGVERELSAMRKEMSAMRRELQDSVASAVTRAIRENMEVFRYVLERQSIARNPTSCAVAYREGTICM